MTPVPWAACCKQRRYGDRSPASYTSIRSTTFGESLPTLLTRNALEAISVRPSPLPSSLGYTVATCGYSFREGQGSNRNFVCGPWVKGRCKSETAYLRCNSRKGGAAASGLSLALSMAWHCAQFSRARLNPRRVSGCARAGPLNRSMTGAMIREILDVIMPSSPRRGR